MITTLSIISLDQGRMWRKEPETDRDQAGLGTARPTLAQRLTAGTCRARTLIEDARPLRELAPES
jgi:hypothetical protein